MICLARNGKKNEVTVLNVVREVIMFQYTSTYTIIIMQCDAKWMQFVGYDVIEQWRILRFYAVTVFLIYATYRMRNHR